MKVAIDIDVLANDPKTGVYNNNQRLLAAFLAMPRDYDVELVYFGAPQPLEHWDLPAGSATVKAVTWLPRKLYHLSLRTIAALPFDLMTGTKADLYVFTKFVRWPLLRRAPSIVVVYDTAYADYPEIIENWHFRKYLTWAVPRGIQRATKVVAISESTKASLIRLYGTPAEKITVIPPAVDHDEFQPANPEAVEAVKQKFGITKPYILSVSTIEPRKNLVTLLRAFAALPTEIQQKYQLVLGGGKGWQNEEIDGLLAELAERVSIIRTGFVPAEDLPALLSGAEVFCFPSLFEGFGMPVLEAMACGAPVITSNNSSLPEAAGDAAIMVEALDVNGLRDAMVKVLADPTLRKQMSQAGLKHAQTFSWQTSAMRLADLINDLKKGITSP